MFQNSQAEAVAISLCYPRYRAPPLPPFSGFPHHKIYVLSVIFHAKLKAFLTASFSVSV